MPHIWSPDPRAVIKCTSTGFGDMGDVTEQSAVARFGSRTARWVLVFIRLHFDSIGGSASGTAPLSINLDSWIDVYHDTRLLPVDRKVGVGADFNFWPEPNDFHAWVFEPMDFISLAWTNPATGGDHEADMRWGMEAAYVEVDTSVPM